MPTTTEALLQLALPRDCAGCGRDDRTLCARCRAVFGVPWRCEEGATFLAPLPGDDSADPLAGPQASGRRSGAWPVWALAAYRGAARHAVLAWKTGVRPDLAGPLRDVIAAAVPDVLADLADRAPSAGRAGEAGPTGPPMMAVVPAPSGWRRRAAGRFVVAELADAVGRSAAATTGGCRVLVLDVLRRRGTSGHLLGAAARGRRGAVVVRTALPAGLRCLLVDDVVTTGATLVACRDALRDAGADPVGAIVLAATPAPGTPVRPLPSS